MASVTGFMAGATIIFSIPVGVAMLDKKYHHYMALGIMCGLLSIPVGVLASCLLMMGTDVSVRPDVNTAGEATHLLTLSLSQVLANLAPLAVFCGVLAICLWFSPT